MFIILFTNLILSTDFFQNTPVYPVSEKKLSRYIPTGIIQGGDSSIRHATVKSIRHSIHEKFERLVFELEPAAISTQDPLTYVPYFSLAWLPERSEFFLTFFQIFDSNTNIIDMKNLKKNTKNQLLKEISFLPKLEDPLWSVNIKLKDFAKVSLEAFILTQPSRLVVDLQKNN